MDNTREQNLKALEEAFNELEYFEKGSDKYESTVKMIEKMYAIELELRKLEMEEDKRFKEQFSKESDLKIAEIEAKTAKRGQIIQAVGGFFGGILKAAGIAVGAAVPIYLYNLELDYEEDHVHTFKAGAKVNELTRSANDIVRKL